jgi:hypothetical protein
MTRTLLALLLCLVATPALAQDGPPLGFTQDGAFFVIGRYQGIGGDEIESYAVLDVRARESLDAVEWLTPEAYKEWVGENPLAPLKTGQKSPDGKMEIQVTGKRWRWKDGQLRVSGESTWTGDSGPEVKVPPPSRFRFSVKAGKKSWPSADFVFDHTNMDQRVEFIWSPDGRRVAYVVHDESEHGGVGCSVTFGPTQGPRVQVLGVKSTEAEDYAKAEAALEGAGLYPVASGQAKEAHPKTTVFAAKGFEAEAKKAAQALGGTVAPLTWKPGYDLVVVLGAKE